MNTPTVEPLTQRPAAWAAVERTDLAPNLEAFLRDAVAQHPDEVLMDFFEAGLTVTYREFADMVDDMTSVLTTIGISRGDTVGAVMRSVPEFPTTMFALARLGATIVPINFKYTASEVQFVADDADLKAIVIAEEFAPVLRDVEHARSLGRERVVVIGDDEHEVGRLISGIPRSELPDELPEVAPDEVLSFQYTSGTTGFPKGCRLTHRYWLEATAAGLAILGPRTRVLEDMPWFYMSGPISHLQAMACGGAVVMPAKPSLTHLWRWIHEQRIDFCWLGDELLNREPSKLDRGHRLTVVWTAGSKPGSSNAMQERFGVAARECYGMTEIGIGTVVPGDDPALAATGSIGFAAPFREVKFINETGAELPAGQVGEMCIRGAGILRGYHNRPQANEELFLDGGWFRTGDLAYQDERGAVFFIGRIKDTIRRSGENISAAEVEAVVTAVEGVYSAAAIPVPDETRGEEVKVYVVLDDDRTAEQVTPDHVLSNAAERLAPFKVPRYLEYIGELPLTASGKVAKAELKRGRADQRVGSWDRIDKVWR